MVGLHFFVSFGSFYPETPILIMISENMNERSKRMGLDTFVFAIRKPTHDEMKWVKENDLVKVKGTGKYLILSKARVDDEPELYTDMQPYWELVSTTETQFDWMKCLADHGVSCEDDLAFSGRTPNGVSFGFASGAEITMTIEEYDIAYRIASANKFLQEGNKVKVTLRMKGREQAYVKKAIEVVKEFCDRLAEVGTADKAPELMGRNIFVIISPKKTK
jgi:hypothetical protein